MVCSPRGSWAVTTGEGPVYTGCQQRFTVYLDGLQGEVHGAPTVPVRSVKFAFERGLGVVCKWGVGELRQVVF